MNWSRAKNILIIALVITNIVLLGTYLSNERKEQKQIANSTQSAVEYMEKAGIKISCTVPEKSEKISVITLKFLEGDSAGGLSVTEFEGLPLEIIGLKSLDYVDYIEKTDRKVDTLPAYTALLKSLDSVNEEIDDVKLIYLVDRSAYAGQAGEDTALPYWKIGSKGNSYYYSAFAE